MRIKINEIQKLLLIEATRLETRADIVGMTTGLKPSEVINGTKMRARMSDIIIKYNIEGVWMTVIRMVAGDGSVIETGLQLIIAGTREGVGLYQPASCIMVPPCDDPYAEFEANGWQLPPIDMDTWHNK